MTVKFTFIVNITFYPYLINLKSTAISLCILVIKQ